MPGKSHPSTYPRVAFEIPAVRLPSGKIGTKHCGYGIRCRVGNTEMELFPVKVLCHAIERSRGSILQWEEVKTRSFWKPDDQNNPFGSASEYDAEFAVLPKPLYNVPQSKINRWYSRHQINVIRTALILHEAVKGRTKIDWWSIATYIEENWRG